LLRPIGLAFAAAHVEGSYRREGWQTLAECYNLLGKMVRAKQFVVRGRVQGVGYRYFALEAAERHDIQGYARNLFNGDVEVHAQGEESALESFKQELQQGPRMAYVTQVLETDAAVSEAHSSFQIRG
jgi:acylphosphatase